MWLISVPVWGERYLDILERATWPALRLAIEELGQKHLVIVHTDQPERVGSLLGRDSAVFSAPAVPGGDMSFGSLSAAHSEVLGQAGPGDRVCLLAADLVISRPMLANCEHLFRRMRKRVVGVAGMRTSDVTMPPDTTDGHALLAWAWENRHTMTRECTWPDGRSYDVWRMYFESGDQVICRLALPHPIALVKGTKLVKFYPTVDVNVVSNFAYSETHIITEPHEGAMIELSPPDKEFVYTETMRTRYDRRCESCPPFVQLRNARHRRFFEKRIIIKGSGGDCGDGLVARRLLAGE